MIRRAETGQSRSWPTGASRLSFALAAVLLLACVGDVARAVADPGDVCALASAECSRAPSGLDVSALPASAPVLGAPPVPMVFASHQAVSGDHRSHVTDAPAPRAPPVA